MLGSTKRSEVGMIVSGKDAESDLTKMRSDDENTDWIQCLPL